MKKARAKTTGKKLRVRLIGALLVLLCAVLGGAVGIMVASASDSAGLGIVGTLVYGALMIAYIFVATYLHMIMHELGHLVLGGLSGFEFVSFRVQSLMIIRRDGRLRFARYSVAGTGGQCLMMPRLEHELKCPYVLYNLGGVIFNLLLSCIGVLLYFFTDSLYGGTVYVITALVGVVMAALNGIPMVAGGVPNDARNIMAIRQSPEARHAFWVQLRVNGEFSSGRRLRDMPRGWFSLSANADLENPIVAGIGVLRSSYLHDRRIYDAAEALADYMIYCVDGLPEMLRNELRCELLFYEIIGRCRSAEIERLYGDALQKYIKTTLPYSIARCRQMYAYELLYRGDKAAAGEYADRMSKMTASYPYAAEIEAENEAVMMVSNMAEERKPK